MIQGVAVGITKIQEGPNGIKDYKNSAGDDLKEGLKIQGGGWTLDETTYIVCDGRQRQKITVQLIWNLSSRLVWEK